MKKTLYRFAVNMRNKITRTQASFKSRTIVLNCHHQVLYSVHICVTIVDTNGLESESKSTSTFANNDRGLELHAQVVQVSIG